MDGRVSLGEDLSGCFLVCSDFHGAFQTVESIRWFDHRKLKVVTKEMKTHFQPHCLWDLVVWFLRASAMLKHVIAIGLTSVCPSVCLSVRHTLAPYQNG